MVQQMLRGKNQNSQHLVHHNVYNSKIKNRKKLFGLQKHAKLLFYVLTTSRFTTKCFIYQMERSKAQPREDKISS